MPLTTSERFLWMAISSTSAPVHLRVPIHLNLFAFPPLLMASTLKNDPASSPRRKKRSISKSGWSTNVSNWAHFDGISFFVLLEKFELHWLVFFFFVEVSFIAGMPHMSFSLAVGCLTLRCCVSFLVSRAACEPVNFCGGLSRSHPWAVFVCFSKSVLVCKWVTAMTSAGIFLVRHS